MPYITDNEGTIRDMIEIVSENEWKKNTVNPFHSYGTGSFILQRSSPSSPETTDIPIENKQDFGEAIEIVQDLWDHINSLQELASKHAPAQVERKKARFSRKYQRLLSILSSK